MPHVAYHPEGIEFWSSFLQTGNGMPAFVGVPYQRGRGLGSLFRRLFRFAMPLLKSAAKAVGKEALHTTANIATDLAKGVTNPTEVLKSRGREAASNLASRLVQHINTGGEDDKENQPPHHGSRKRKQVSIKRSYIKAEKTHCTRRLHFVSHGIP